MRVKIIPHGILRRFWPTDFECEAATPYEAMNALTSQFKLGGPAPGQKWTVALAGYPTQVSLRCPLASNELHVMPALVGGGGGGFFKVILGAVLVAVSFIPGLGQATWAALPTALFSFGSSLVLGGILEFLTPAPKNNTPTTQAKAEYLGPPKNTTASGTPIPIGYGRFAVYGQFLSFNIESDPAPVTLANEPSPPTSTDYRQGSGDYRYDAGETAGRDTPADLGGASQSGMG